jgi:hypothetical protein
VPVDEPREEQRVPADEVVDLVSRLLARYHTAMPMEARPVRLRPAMVIFKQKRFGTT